MNPRTITSVAGNGSQGASIDNQKATQTNIETPLGLAVNVSGNIFFSDWARGIVYKIDSDGVITTFIDKGLSGPRGLAFDKMGNLYIADTKAAMVFKYDTSGVMKAYAGNGKQGISGDGGPATAAMLQNPSALAVDSDGNLFIADNYCQVRKIDKKGIITTFAGTNVLGSDGDGELAVNAQLDTPSGLAVDIDGNLYIANSGSQRISKVDQNGMITTIAGGESGFSGDGGLAIKAQFTQPTDVALDNWGNLYISDSMNGRVRMIDKEGVITTIAGTGDTSYGGQGLATKTGLNPGPIALDSEGKLYIADNHNNRVFCVTAAVREESGLTTGLFRKANINRPVARMAHRLATIVGAGNSIPSGMREAASAHIQEIHSAHPVPRIVKAGIPTGISAIPPYRLPIGTSAGLHHDNSGWTSLGPHRVGGRTLAILQDPTNSRVIFAASAGGGVWRSEDHGQTWFPTEDLMGNLAVTSLALDPVNGNVFAGTGEQIDGRNGMLGEGIFRSNKEGRSWKQISGTKVTQTDKRFGNVGVLVFSKVNTTSILVSACKSGIFFSTDEMHDVWTQAQFDSRPFSINIASLAIHPTKHGTMVAGSQYNAQVYLSSDGGQNWTELVKPLNSFASGRTQVCFAQTKLKPTDADVPVYASVEVRGAHNENKDGEIWKWIKGETEMTLVKNITGLFGSTGNQGYYDNYIWAGDPTDAKLIVALGVDLYRSKNGKDFSKIGGVYDGGKVHADQHYMIEDVNYGKPEELVLFEKNASGKKILDGSGTAKIFKIPITNKRVFLGNDGGIYTTHDISTVDYKVKEPKNMAEYNALGGKAWWQEINNGYGVTQFYDLAAHTGKRIVIAGAQDNGSVGHTPGEFMWNNEEVTGGDGGYCAANQNNPSLFYGEYVYGGIIRSDRVLSANGKVSWAPKYISGNVSVVDGQGKPTGSFYQSTYVMTQFPRSAEHFIPEANSSTAEFIAPFLLDPINLNVMLVGCTSLYQTMNAEEQPSTARQNPTNKKTAFLPTTLVGPKWKAIKPKGSDGTITAITTAWTSKITRAAGSWIDDGFKAKDQIVIEGSKLNNGEFTVETVSKNDLSIGASLKKEAASDKVTIWHHNDKPLVKGVLISFVNPSSSNIILVGHSKGAIYVSTNGDKASPSFILKKPDLKGQVARCNCLAIDHTDTKRTFYAGFAGFFTDRLQKTTDGGATWTSCSGTGAFKLANVPIYSITIHPKNHFWIYVGTENGVFASEDGGNTWAATNEGPANVPCYGFTWIGETLLVATYGRGVFQIDLTIRKKPKAFLFSGASGNFLRFELANQTKSKLNKVLSKGQLGKALIIDAEKAKTLGDTYGKAFDEVSGISISFNSDKKTITRTKGSWLIDRYVKKGKITITGSTMNNHSFTLKSLDEKTLTVNETIATESDSTKVKVNGFLGKDYEKALSNRGFLGDASGKVYSIDPSSLDLKWTTANTLSGKIHIPPALWACSSRDMVYLLVVTDAGKLHLLDPIDGTELKKLHPTDQEENWPIELKEFGPKDRAWSCEVMDDWAYISSSCGTYAVRLHPDAQVEWHHKASKSNKGLLMAANSCFVSGIDGSLFALKARTDNPKGEPVWSKTTGSKTTTAPAWALGTIVVGNEDGSIVSFEHIDGAERFRYKPKTPTSEVKGLSTDDARIFWLSNDANGTAVLHAMDVFPNPTDLDKAWTISIPEQWPQTLTGTATGSPLLSVSEIYAVTAPGSIHIFERNNPDSRQQLDINTKGAIKVSGAGTVEANGLYQRVTRAELPADAPVYTSDLMWRHTEHKDLVIIHQEKCWWIGHYRDCTKDLYIINHGDPLKPPVNSVWTPCPEDFDNPWDVGVAPAPTVKLNDATGLSFGDDDCIFVADFSDPAETKKKAPNKVKDFSKPCLFTPTGSLSHPRTLHTATLLKDGKVLVVGGTKNLQDSNGVLQSCELFDPTIGTFSTAKGELIQARRNHTATLLLSGKVLITGGAGNDDKELNTAELYDPSTGVWRQTHNLGSVRNLHTATLLRDGKVLVSGGVDQNSAKLLSTEIYDPQTGKWTPTGNLRVARSHHSATLLDSGQVLVVGSVSPPENATSAELYNPATGLWARTGHIDFALYNKKATLLKSGKVLVAGGAYKNNEHIKNSQLFDVAAGNWSPTGNTKEARSYHSETLLINKKVLLAGGTLFDSGIDSSTSKSEIYDPEAGSWSNTASLTIQRYNHTATRLLDGMVLIIGGSQGNSWINKTALANAELYGPKE